MAYENDESYHNPLLETYKRKPLHHPIYEPVELEHTPRRYLDTDTTLRVMPNRGDDHPLKKRLYIREAPFEARSAFYYQPHVDIDRSNSPNDLESRRSKSLDSISEGVFSSASFRSASSSRSSSRTRNSETNESPKVDPQEHDYDLTNFENYTTQHPRISQLDWPTSISSVDQPVATVACLKVVDGACRVPLKSIDGNPSKCNSFNAVKPQSEDDDMDRSSISNSPSLPDASSVPEADGQSTEGDGSTNSKTSSHVSDIGATHGSKKASHDDKLEALIKDDVLRTDPAVAEVFYKAVKGKLEYSAPELAENFEESHKFSLLELLAIEAFIPGQHSAAPTECPSSSSGSSSAPGATQNNMSASTSKQNAGNFSGGSDAIRNASISQDGPNQGVKTDVKSNTSQSSRAQPFRCIHNAIASAIFSVNPDFLEKFRACSGPGWSSIQHLKEHMQNVHTKQVKKINPLQCSRCQDEFQNADELKSHELNVDCAIRCPDCAEIFFTKALRQEHQKECHPEEATDPTLRELDDAIWKQMREQLKSYADSLKNKKGKGTSDLDTDREAWVLANTPRYETGRSKVNAKLELGQWYTMFTTVAPGVKVPDHPFYDYGTPSSDYAEERILYIHEAMIDSRIQVHGQPPSNLELQRAWYREALRDTLRIAAQTRKVSPIKGKAPLRRNNTLAPAGPSPGPVPGPSTMGGQAYNAITTIPQRTPMTPIRISGPNMALSQQQDFHSSTSQPSLQHQQWLMNTGTMTTNPSPINNQSYEPPNLMPDNNGQTSTFPFDGSLDSDFQDLFGGMGGNDHFQSWQDQGGS